MSIFHFNIAAIVNLIVVFLSLRNKNIKSKSARVYYLLILVSFIATISNLLSTIVINFENANIIFIRICQAIFICFFNLTYLVYFSYILSLDQKKSNKKLNVGIILFCLAVVFISALGIGNQSIISIDFGGKLINGIGMYTLYGLAILYCIIIFIYTVIRRNALKTTNIIPVIFYIILHISSILLEFYNELVRGVNINILSFSNSIALLIIYISIENPKSYLDVQTNALNSKTFYDDVDSMIIRNNKLEMVSLYFKDLKFLVEKVGYTIYEEIQKEITEVLKKHAKKIYYVSDNQYVMMGNIKNTKLIKKDGLELLDGKITVNPIVTDIVYGKNFKTREELVKLLSIVKDNNTKDAITRIKRELEVEDYLRKAIEEKSFVVYFQPIYSIKDGKYKSAEVLVRMPNNEAYPDEFIPLAEKLGLINKVDEIIMEKAFEIIRNNDLDKNLKRLEINLSPVECLSKDLSKRVIKLLDKFKISHKFLNLELLETAEILENEIFKNNIKLLKEKGVGFSLDDFGTGYSNIVNVTNYPFNIIKIDKSILYNSFEREKSKKLFINLTELIFNLGYDIIIEGVETEEQYNLCKGLGINNIQGYYFSKPLNSEDFVKTIKGE